MLTVLGILVLAALVTTIIAMMGKCPLTVPVLILCVVEALRFWPLK